MDRKITPEHYKLKIAVEALQHYATRLNWRYCTTDNRHFRHYSYYTEGHGMPESTAVAQEALDKISEIEQAQRTKTAGA
jgi:hypothetical protein